MDVYPKCRLNVTYIEWLGMIKQKTKSETITKIHKSSMEWHNTRKYLQGKNLDVVKMLGTSKTFCSPMVV